MAKRGKAKKFQKWICYRARWFQKEKGEERYYFTEWKMLLTTSEDAPKTNKPVESWKLVSATDSTVVTESGDLGKGWGLKRSR